MTAPLFVVRGGGLSGWGAAAMLARHLPAARIILVDPQSGERPSTLDVAALDADALLLRLAGVPDTVAGPLLGTIFERWCGERPLIHAPQEALPTIDGVAIHDLVLRAATGLGRRGDYAALHAPLRFQARAAARGLYAPPSPDRRSPRSLLRPGVLADGQELTRTLRDRALAAGVTMMETIPDAAALLTIETRAGRRGGTWRERPDGTGHRRRLTLRLRGPAPSCVAVRVVPLAAGLLVASPAPDGIIATLTHAIGDAEAEEAMMAAFAGMNATAGEAEDHAPGFDPAPWDGRTLHLGPAAASLGAVMGFDAALLDRQLASLATCLPADPAQAGVCALAYNTSFAETAEHHADFLRLIMMHGPLARAAAPVSPTLARRLEQFVSRNRAVTLDGDPFEPEVWIETMIALGLIPRRYDPQADRLSPAAVQDRLARMVQAFDRTLEAMPRYGA